MVVRSFLAVAFVLAAVPAAAEDVPLPPLTPEGEHLVMTQDDATSTSTCIGDPVTPMCAVETVLACFARYVGDLCRTGMGLESKPDVLGEWPWDNLIYRVTRAEILTGKHFPWRPAHDLPWRPGEISMQGGDARIDILLRECKDSFSQEDCRFSFGILSFIVRKEKGRWSVMMWQPPYDTADQYSAGTPGLAEEVPLPEITPEGEYLVMTQDDATSTSQCIGNPITPMCAVETVIACHARGNHDLCQTGMGLNHDPGLGGKGPSDDRLYWVTRSEVLTGEHFPWRPARDLPWRFGEIEMRAGDVRIDIVRRDCAEKISPAACSPPSGTVSYIVRKIRGRWAVMVWQPPYDTADQYSAGTPGLAEEVPLPEITPEGEYLVMTQDNATSTSRCIGNPITPMCAVETVIACHARGDHDLCKIGMGLNHDPGLGGEGPWHDMIYRVTRAEILTGEHFPWRPARDLPWRFGEIEMRAGDVRIDIVLNLCDGDPIPGSCDFSYGTLTYVVRKQQGGWAVVTWQPPYDVEDQ